MDVSNHVSANFIGRDKFNWWVGQIEKSVDTSKNSNRVKVRIVGYHSDRKSITPEDLPWAQILYPPTNSQMSGQGTKVMLLPGQWCIGFFLDGDEQQIPIISGLLGGTVNTDDNGQVDPGSFTTPENIWKKPDYVEPNNVGKSPVTPSADKTKDQPHTTIKAKVPDPTGKSPDDFPATRKPEVVANDNYCSNAQQDLSQKESYEVPIGDGVCATKAQEDHMGVRIAEFMEKLKTHVSTGEQWVNKKTGAVLDMTATVQTYATALSEMMKNPLSALIRYMVRKVAETYEQAYPAVANPNPFSLEGIKKTFDEALNVIKCIMESGLLDTLFDLFKGILDDLVSKAENSISGTIAAADCAISGIMSNVFGKVLDAVQTVLGVVTDLLSAISGFVSEIAGFITGIIDAVMGFANQLLGFLGCFDKDIEKCGRSNKFNTKQGFIRPTLPTIPDFASIVSPLGDIGSGGGGGGCKDPDQIIKPPDNRQQIVPGQISPEEKQNIELGLDLEEEYEGFICSTVIDAVINGDLDISAVVQAAVTRGQISLPEVFANASSVEAALASGGGDPESSYLAVGILSQLGVLDQFPGACPSGEGPSYGVRGKLKKQSDGTYVIGNLDKPLITGSWVRVPTDKKRNFKIVDDRYIPLSDSIGGTGATIILPIDRNGYPATNGIVLDGGRDYGNGNNGKCAPDLFVHTQMYDPSTNLPVEDYYLKGTAFVNSFGQIVSASFNNENGYVFRETPYVSVNECGGEIKDPSSKNTVNDPNTLTNQTNTTIVINAENTGISGLIDSVYISNVGQYYTDPEVIVEPFDGDGCKGYGAELTARVSNGRIIGIDIVNAGSDYTCVPNIIIKDRKASPSSKFGRGARATAVLKYVPVTNPSLIARNALQQTVQVVDCP